MAQPTAYTRQYNFTDYQSSSPADPLPADQVDAELNAVNLTLSEMRTNLGLLQRDDTKLANAAVHAESLSTAVLALIKATENGYGVKGAWAASTAYAIGDLVDFTQATYLCHEAHTSGSTFAANSSKFILLANAAIQSSASSVDVLSGDGATTAFTLSSNAPSGVTDVLVFVNGSLRTPTTHYTVSGTTITFVTAPSSGTDNVIVWGTSTVVEAAKTAVQAARDTAEAHRDDASEHKTTAERWANLEDATVVDADTSVDSGEYSAKEYAVGDTVTTGSAKDWASKAYNSPVVTSPSNEYSAKHYAQNIQEWATKDDGAVSGTDYSAKAHASVEGTNAPPEGSAKEWATAAEDTVVAGSEYSAKHYAAKAATDYASFTGVYKTGATDPYSSKDSGDLWYDTSASTLKVWSGSAWNELDTLPQNLGATDTPTFATPTASGHAAIKSYVDANAGDSLPSQTGQSGKFLKTDGSSTSWDTASTLPAIASGDAGKQLTVNTAEDGTYWGGATPVTFTATLDTSATVTPFSFTDSSSVAWTVWEFTGNGTFSPSGPCTVDFMVVAGGGSGGDSSHWGAGGGAGELVWKTSQSFVEADYDVTVGDATTASSLTSQDGNDSSLSGTGISITAEGGGHGGDAGVGSAGGSGGGSSCSSNVGGTGNAEDDGDSTTFGFDGGAGHANCHFSGGGGGGAGGAGEDAGSGGSNTYGMGGNGGEGKDMSSYFGTTVGHDGWFAGGGGGFGYYHLDARRGYGNGGSTGKGGGGEGTESTNDDTTTIRSLGTDGMANTGGGGGGYAHNNYEGASSAYTKRGGSGVVILRVRKDS